MFPLAAPPSQHTVSPTRLFFPPFISPQRVCSEHSHLVRKSMGLWSTPVQQQSLKNSLFQK